MIVIVTDNSTRSVEGDRDEIDAPHSIFMLGMPFSESLSGEHEPLKLSYIHALGSIPRRLPGPYPNFNKDQFVALQRDDVKLAATHTPVPSDDGISAGFQATYDEFFASPASLNVMTSHQRSS